MEHNTETTILIAADKVAGTSVYNAAGENLGEIHDVMIDKASGKVAYAVMAFGGFLGIGDEYHPVPWSRLKYDTAQGGYIVNLDKQQLDGAPVYSEDAEPQWADRAYDEKVYGYYKEPPYWGVT
jgi:sporulation protein YlmC with PRC-barrel domain